MKRFCAFLLIAVCLLPTVSAADDEICISSVLFSSSASTDTIGPAAKPSDDEECDLASQFNQLVCVQNESFAVVCSHHISRILSPMDASRVADVWRRASAGRSPPAFPA
jgi:hypothetical protein